MGSTIFSAILWFLIASGLTFLLIFLFAALLKAAAPMNKREQLRDDYEQMKTLHYFDSPEGKLSGEILLEKIKSLTSGCPVENNK